MNPVLAFIKACRLRSDRDSLFKIVLSHFDISRLSGALKTLWDHCSLDLEELHLSFHQRRSNEAVLNDLYTAIDKLDLANKLPTVFCEACDLITIPSLEVDPVSQRIEQNSASIDSLTKSFNELPNLISNAISESLSLISPLKSLEATAQKLHDYLNHLRQTSPRVASPATQHVTDVNHQGLGSNPVTSKKSSIRYLAPDRSMNIICFGLPEESSLADLNKSVNKVLSFLVGSSVTFVDVIRLGKRSKDSQLKPRPLLIKLASVWDRRMIMSNVRKLKDYQVSKLYIREDLSPEDSDIRKEKFKKSKPSSVNKEHDLVISAPESVFNFENDLEEQKSDDD